MSESIEEQLREAARQWIAAGGSQPKLAEAAGVSQPTLSGWLSGQYGTRLAHADRIASAIGRPIRVGGRRAKTKDVSDTTNRGN